MDYEFGIIIPVGVDLDIYNSIGGQKTERILCVGGEWNDQATTRASMGGRILNQHYLLLIYK